jgi:hypothetical protein
MKMAARMEATVVTNEAGGKGSIFKSGHGVVTVRERPRKSITRERESAETALPMVARNGF